jgi:magnesium-protoporphyrin O-methyltransferase
MFDARRARKDLRTYRKRGPRGATLRLLDALRASMRERALVDFTHLDIGGGVGVLQHELARDGAVRTTAVDASRPYLELLRKAAAERGYEARQRRVEGDFTEVADSIEAATVVTLDKVICCYPDMATLVRASARKATALYGIVVPRDTVWVRVSVGLANWSLRHVLRRQFRAFAHSLRAIDRLCAEEGLNLDRDDPGFMWCVRLYRRSA